MSANMTCVEGQSRAQPPNSTSPCFCYPAYYGQYCEKRYAWWDGLNYFYLVVHMLPMLIALYWSIVKTIQLGAGGYFTFKKLSNLALLSVVIGCAIRLVMRLVTPDSLADSEGASNTSKIIFAFSAAIPVALWMSSTSLLVGYWVDSLASRFWPGLAKGTKIAVLIGCLLLLTCTIPGILMQSIFNNAAAGGTLTMVPLIVNGIGLLVYLIKLRRLHSGKGALSDRGAERRDFATKMFTILLVEWIIYIITVIALIATNFMTAQVRSYATFPIVICFALSEGSLPLTLLALLDRQAGPFRLTRWIFTCCCSDEAGEGASGTSTSTKKQKKSENQSSASGSVPSSPRSTETSSVVVTPEESMQTSSAKDSSGPKKNIKAETGGAETSSSASSKPTGNTGK